MRICHLLETSGGGSGQVVLDLVEAGLRYGDEIVLFFSPDRAEPHFLRAVRRLSEQRVRVHTLPMRRAVGPYDAVSLLRLMRRLCFLGPIDVIHSHSSKAGALARLAGFCAPKAVQIYTPHAFVTMAPDAPRLYGKIEHWLSWLCDGLICVSAAEAEHAQNELGIAPSRLFVVPNGVKPFPDGARGEARAQLGFEEDAIVVGFVGRLTPQKNPARALAAFAAQAARDPLLRLAIVGNGPLLSVAKRQVAEAGLESRVRFFEGRPARDFIPGFDCLLCGSDYEGFPLVFLEALAAGVPIVTTPVGGTAEAVHAGATGFIADAFSDAALGAALGAFLACDEPARRAMGQEALALSREFSVDAMAQKVREVYATCWSRRLRKKKRSL